MITAVLSDCLRDLLQAPSSGRVDGEPSGEELVLGEKVVGRITSRAGDRALAYVRVEVPEDAVLEAGAARLTLP